MIKGLESFADVGKKEVDISEINNKNLGFNDIKPNSDISLGEATDFWEKELKNPFGAEINKNISIEDILDYAEEDFTFDDKIDKECRAIIEEIYSKQWDELNDSEKKDKLEVFKKKVGEMLRLDNIPQINYYKGEEGDCGGFDLKTGNIYLNDIYLSDSSEMINTIAHEMRHVYQFEHKSSPENDNDFLYLENINNYISPKFDSNGKCVNYHDYEGQFIEAEARAYADQFVKERFE